MTTNAQRKPIHGYNGLYEVDEFGGVYSLERRTLYKDGRSRITPNRKLLPAKNKSGYWGVSLWRDGRGKTMEVHVLVARAFHGESPAGHEVRHLDGNSCNNHFSNLKWGTRLENVGDMWRHGTAVIRRGEDRSRFTSEQILEIRNALDECNGSRRKLQQKLSVKYGVTRSCLESIFQRRTWRHLPEGNGPGHLDITKSTVKI